MKKSLKAAAVVLACLFLVPALANAGTILVVLDMTTPPSGIITPNTASMLLGAWDMPIPNVEGLSVTTAKVGLDITGSVIVQNLKLFVNGVEVGGVIGTAGNSNIFSTFLVVPAGLTDVLTVLGDVGSGNGTLRASIMADGISAIGTTTLDAYTGPAQTVYAMTQQVGAGNQAPEPGTLVTMVVGVIIIGFGSLRRRRTV